MMQQGANPLDQFDDMPPPIVRTQHSAEALAQAQAEWDWDCQRACARRLVHEVAQNIGGQIPIEELWLAMQRVPSREMDNLYTPAGWAYLAEYLQLGLPVPARPYVPTVH